MSKRFLDMALGLLSLAGLATAGLFMYQVIHYSSNAPIGNDDIDLILIDTISILKAQSVDEWLTSLLHQNMEHLPASLRLFGILSYVVTGYISLPFINILSACILLVSLVALLRAASPNWLHALFMAGWAVPLVIAPLHHECLLWASCSSSHYTVIGFGCLALFFALRTGWLAFIGFEIACLLSLLSLFSGLLVPLLGGLIIYLRQEQPKIKRILLLAHIAITVVSVGSYIAYIDLNFTQISPPPAIIASAPYPAVSNALVWLFAWAGAWLDISREIHLSILRQPVIPTPWGVIFVGATEILIVLIVLWHSHRTLGKKYLHIQLMLIYLSCTIAIAAVQRSAMLPIAYVFTSRYQLYTQWLAVCLLGLLFILLRNSEISNGNRARFHLYTAALCLASLMFYAEAFQRFNHILENSYARNIGCINTWQIKGKAPKCWWHNENKAKLDSVIESGKFRMN